MNSSSNTLPLSKAEADKIHWDSIVDVCTGKSKTLTEAKSKRMASLEQTRRVEALGICGPLVDIYTSDRTLLDMTECIMNGGKWGDIWYTDTFRKLKAVEADLAAIRASTDSGRWRRAAELYPLRDALQRELGHSVV